MKPFTRRADLLVFLYMCVAGSVWRAVAQPGGGHTFRSLEARMAQTRTVFCATITNLQESVVHTDNGRASYDIFGYRGCLKVNEVLKGDVSSKLLEFRIDGVSEWPDLKKWARERVPFLWFVNGPEDQIGRDFFAGVNYIFLGSPAQEREGGFERVYGSDMALLTEPKEILKRARAFAKGQLHTTNFHRIYLPEFSTDDHFMGRSYLLVPIEPSLEHTATHLISVPDDFISRKTERDRLQMWRCDLRAEGVSALQYFRSRKNIRLLKSLVNDPAYWAIKDYAETNMVRKTYSVRRNACGVLQGWGVDTPKPVTEEMAPANATRQGNGSSFLTSGRELYETHVCEGRPSVAIYTKGFVDSSFDAYLSDTNGERLVFSFLPATLSQFGGTGGTNSHTLLRGAKRLGQRGPGMYDLFWSNEQLRLGLEFRGYFVAGYDLKTGQSIQLTAGRESPGTCRAVSQAIGEFLNGATMTGAQIERMRRESYGP